MTAICRSTSVGCRARGGGLSTADATLGILRTLTSSLARARRTDLVEGAVLFSWEGGRGRRGGREGRREKGKRGGREGGREGKREEGGEDMLLHTCGVCSYMLLHATCSYVLLHVVLFARVFHMYSRFIFIRAFS